MIDEVEKFHGHMCPGVAIGILAACVALAEFGRSSDLNEIVAITETNMCAVDGIQYLMGCTVGRGNLIQHDHGKNAYSFVRTSDGASLRLTVKQEAWRRSPEHEALLAKTKEGIATDDETRRYWDLQRDVSARILDQEPGNIFNYSREQVSVSRPSRDMHYLVCDSCKEMTNVSRLKKFGNEKLCEPCSASNV